jgi:hypothetical protein
MSEKAMRVGESLAERREAVVARAEVSSKSFFLVFYLLASK